MIDRPNDPAPRPRRILLALLAAVLGLVGVADAPPAAATGSESRDRTSYVLMTAGSNDTTMSGSTEDLARARALRSGREGLLYVSHDGAAWVIRDPATLRRAEAIFAPQEALGARQAALGARQAALGARQARLGGEQARIGRLQAGASPARSEALGRQMDALGRQQDALGLQQDALGRQQDALGREQDRLSRVADDAMRDLLADAIRRRVAVRAD
jgi:hypothetical protein